MSKKKMQTLGDIYGDMLNQVEVVKESKIKKGGNELNDGMPVQDGGPTKQGGWHKALEDLFIDTEEDEESEDCDSCEEDAEGFGYHGPVKGINRMKDKYSKESNPKKKKNLEKHLKSRERDAMMAEGEEELEENVKISKQQINKIMSKQKSVFDSLYQKIVSENFDAFGEDAEDDIDALGLDEATPDSDLDDDFGGEDEVTFTLDRATAQALCDVLQGALGEGEMEDEGLDFDDEGDDFDDEGDDFGGEDDDLDFEEDEEGYMPTDHVGNDGTVKDIVKGGHHPLQQKNNKVKGKPQPKGGKAGTTNNVMDKVGNDGTKDGQPNYGKQNKVSNLKQGEDFFR